MTERALKILQEAKNLSVEERADLAAQLLATLPDEWADELHPEWAEELIRRDRLASEDPDGGIPWDEVERRLRARIQR